MSKSNINQKVESETLLLKLPKLIQQTNVANIYISMTGNHMPNKNVAAQRIIAIIKGQFELGN